MAVFADWWRFSQLLAMWLAWKP